jgi:hypothetical protein
MDLEKQANIVPTTRAISSDHALQEPVQTSIFEAVRRWTDDEGMGTFDIEVDGRRLTPDEIQEIAHSSIGVRRTTLIDRSVARIAVVPMNALALKCGANYGPSHGAEHSTEHARGERCAIAVQ